MSLILRAPSTKGQKRNDQKESQPSSPTASEGCSLPAELDKYWTPSPPNPEDRLLASRNNFYLSYVPRGWPPELWTNDHLGSHWPHEQRKGLFKSSSILRRKNLLFCYTRFSLRITDIFGKPYSWPPCGTEECYLGFWALKSTEWREGKSKAIERMDPMERSIRPTLMIVAWRGTMMRRKTTVWNSGTKIAAYDEDLSSNCEMLKTWGFNWTSLGVKKGILDNLTNRTPVY